ncbi:MAG TPA: aspartyl/asparaginyl beta-hydroxylase domain-containing protein [Candidatus Cybelea sp.]|nr:aspartyl/asparaginyl beta-hydroxylase domain-containing protein [Candidatus Cybelea sp.]
MTDWYAQACGIVRSIYQKRIASPSVLDASIHFPAGRKFEDAWLSIRAEALAIAQSLEQVPRFHELMAEQASLSANDGRDWRVFVLKIYGVEVPRNMERCPQLSALLRECPEVVSATFSFLAPRKHIPYHWGPFKGVLRYHLCLSVPRLADGRPAVLMNIDGSEYRLGDGDTLLWDDTYPHEVWNQSDETRVALLLDVWRQDMPIDMSVLSRILLAGIQTTIRYRQIGQFS